MAWLNIVGILIVFFLSKPAIKALKDYEQQKSQGVKDYTFNPVALGIKGATYWENKFNKKSQTSGEQEGELDAVKASK
ncbi:sodium/alanine symporter [Vibrio sp. JCM 19236]|nr:sodium/alanine symporter [Vibrio sp. JCM 19236]